MVRFEKCLNVVVSVLRISNSAVCSKLQQTAIIVFGIQFVIFNICRFEPDILNS